MESLQDEFDILEGKDPKDRKKQSDDFKPWKAHIAGPE